ncbi:HAD family hydrolase [Winogradskyella tangerina]|uniref:HAD family hydrolase n=1 Tax=Winogradskyella tangerina TaxID=2023240 RepID=UPI000DBE48F8|nr:HAD family hydrolase [Winogradskyella tangerina]
MNPEVVITDFDGVVGNSLRTAIEVAKGIVNLFDENEVVEQFDDYRRLIGKHGTLPHREKLREMHRLLMEHHGASIKPFTDVLQMYSALKRKPYVLSSSYIGTIEKVLSDNVSIFEAIYGFEEGPKEVLLNRLKQDLRFIYITDTIVDIARCKSIDVPVIAVTWGYDGKELLQNAKPDFLIDTPMELKNVLRNLNLI